MFNIAVIGGGVIGVTSAIQLQNDIKNANITIFADKLSPETTGDLSAGLWTPYLLENTSEDDITRWSKATHDFCLKLWQQGLGDILGICLQPVLRLFTEVNNKNNPKWMSVPFGAMMLELEQVEKLSKQFGKNYKAASHYVSFTCEPAKLLPFLLQEFLQHGGALVKMKINKFSDLSSFDVIVNCTGLESRSLIKDDEIHAVRGQISRVQAPWQFQVISDESDDGNYIIPNSEAVILGGTHQIGNESLVINLQDKKNILDGCSKIFPGLKTCTQCIDGVGLRPGRNRVRLETEEISTQDKLLKIVHNYGHGGAGVTLCIGCAEDASILVKNVLGMNQINSHL